MILERIRGLQDCLRLAALRPFLGSTLPLMICMFQSGVLSISASGCLVCAAAKTQKLSSGWMSRQFISRLPRRAGIGWETAPRAALARSFTFRIKCELMVFDVIHLMSNTIRVRETYTKYARRFLVSPTLETTSPACRRFSTSGFSVSSPTATVAMNSPSASRLSFSHWGCVNCRLQHHRRRMTRPA